MKQMNAVTMMVQNPPPTNLAISMADPKRNSRPDQWNARKQEQHGKEQWNDRHALPSRQEQMMKLE
jgi:hypothetical protein